MSDSSMAVMIFIILMALIISEKVHRAVAAVLGAVMILVTGIMDVKTAAGYIDFNTIGVLTGMMLFVAVVKNSGLFEYLAVKSAKIAGGDPWRIMMIFMVITAALSSLLDNVTTVLLMGPVTVAITETLGINPIPFFMTQIMASNIGGTATLIGDPPNIMIGSAAGLSFMDFIAFNGPITAVALAAVALCFRVTYGMKMSADAAAVRRIMRMNEKGLIKDRSLLIKSIVMTVMTVSGFVLHSILGLETSVVALSAAAVMLMLGRQDPEKTVSEVEWTTIIFFIGLFIVVGSLVETGLIDRLAGIIMEITDGNKIMTMIIVLWVSALLSSTLDNIPFVATMIPLIAALGSGGMDVLPLWWALSLGACLGGNGTLVGASANVVMAGVSEKKGYRITYMGFLKVGFPTMLMTVALCTVYMLLRFG